MIATALTLAAFAGQEALGPAKPAPAFQAVEWLNAERPVDIKKLRGRVVLVLTNPTFCCGYDFTVKMTKEALRRYRSRGLSAIGLFYGKLDREQREVWEQVRASESPDWPIAVDDSEKTIASIYPDGQTRYSFCFVDRKGNLRTFKMTKLEDVYPLTEKLLSEPG